MAFDSPDNGSFIQNKATGVKTWLRQESGVFYLDLWVCPKSVFARPGVNW